MKCYSDGVNKGISTVLKWSTHLPTIMSSRTFAALRICLYMSMVKRVLALLKMEDRSLISAASITDSITPFRPEETTMENRHIVIEGVYLIVFLLVAYFTKEINSRPVKPPLEFNGSLVKFGLNSWPVSAVNSKSGQWPIFADIDVVIISCYTEPRPCESPKYTERCYPVSTWFQ